MQLSLVGQPFPGGAASCPAVVALGVLGFLLLSGSGGHEAEEEPRSQSSQINGQGRQQVCQDHIFLFLPHSSQNILGHLHRPSALGRGLVHN